MLFLAILATVVSVFLTLMIFVIFWASMMSGAAVAGGFQGLWIIIVPWLITIALYAGWWFDRQRRN